MDLQVTLREIRKRCRLAMNGDVSASMRKYGLQYKLNFGLLLSQIKEIAGSYSPDAELSRLLWVQDTRELKILATMLYPTTEFSKENATEWVLSITNQEIREQITINLLQNLPYAEDLVLEWVRVLDNSLRTTGYWLLGRLLLAKKMVSFDDLDALSLVWNDVLSSDAFLRNSSLLALKQIGRKSPSLSNEILKCISDQEIEDMQLKAYILDNLRFEFEYYN